MDKRDLVIGGVYEFDIKARNKYYRTWKEEPVHRQRYTDNVAVCYSKWSTGFDGYPVHGVHSIHWGFIDCEWVTKQVGYDATYSEVYREALKTQSNIELHMNNLAAINDFFATQSTFPSVYQLVVPLSRMLQMQMQLVEDEKGMIRRKSWGIGGSHG